MRVLRPVVQVLRLPVLDRRHHLPMRHCVTAELVGDQHPRRRALPLEEFAEEPLGGLGAAQNTCTFSLIMCLKNLATNTLIPTGVATTARTRGTVSGTHEAVTFPVPDLHPVCNLGGPIRDHRHSGEPTTPFQPLDPASAPAGASVSPAGRSVDRRSPGRATRYTGGARADQGTAPATRGRSVQDSTGCPTAQRRHIELRVTR